LAKIVRREYQSSAATIHGFRRLCVRDGNYPALVISPRAQPILGRLYRDLSTEDIARLDHFETDEYERVAVITAVDGNAVTAQAYLAVNVNALIPTEWDAKAFEKAGLPDFLATYVVKNTPPI
jgi:hypothetical protein